MIGMFALAVFVLVACLIIGVMRMHCGWRISRMRRQRAEQHRCSGKTLHG